MSDNPKCGICRENDAGEGKMMCPGCRQEIETRNRTPYAGLPVKQP
ncbi:hypothetical protein [Nocardia sp. SYP-A9097]|nr:hypothetical protein [Nocardia sp. SYP-A9097]